MLFRSVNSRQPIGPPMRHTDGVLSISFSPDGTRLATGSEDGQACVWSAATGQRLAPPMHHKYQVTFVQFVAEGRALFTMGKDGMVRLWDTMTGEPLIPSVSHGRNLSTAAVSADGRHIACGTADGRMFVYSFPEETRPVSELVTLSEQLTSRHLDPEAGLMPALLENLTNLPTALTTRRPGGRAVP